MANRTSLKVILEFVCRCVIAQCLSPWLDGLVDPAQLKIEIADVGGALTDTLAPALAAVANDTHSLAVRSHSCHHHLVSGLHFMQRFTGAAPGLPRPWCRAAAPLMRNGCFALLGCWCLEALPPQNSSRLHQSASTL